MRNSNDSHGWFLYGSHNIAGVTMQQRDTRPHAPRGINRVIQTPGDWKTLNAIPLTVAYHSRLR